MIAGLRFVYKIRPRRRNVMTISDRFASKSWRKSQMRCTSCEGGLLVKARSTGVMPPSTILSQAHFLEKRTAGLVEKSLVPALRRLLDELDALLLP